MAKQILKFNNKEYSIDSSVLADATARLEAHLTDMMENSEVLEGDGAEYYTLAPTPLSFRSTAPLSELQDVTINGEVIDPSNYTLEEGSTIVTFPIEYLKTLEKGNYEVAINSQSKSVKGGFTVAAPVLNEYGFYYNQAYTVYVGTLGGNTTFFLRDNGTMDCMVNGNVTETATYSASNKAIVVNSMMGTFNGEISIDGTEIYCPELASTFILGDESIVADEDYIYIYREDLGGYEVIVIDKTKAEYGAIKTGINGIDTVKLAGGMFAQFDENGVLVYIEGVTTAPKIPDSVTIIGDYAFAQCQGLSNIVIPNSVISIEERAFYWCKSLINIEIPNSVTEIGSFTFYACHGLTSIEIPDGVEIINHGSFGYCTNLKNVVIPNSVWTIGESAFGTCSSLANITFNGTTAQWNAITKEVNWNFDVPATHVHCIDGDVAL